MDREPDAACALSALLHRSDDRVPSWRRLDDLPLVEARLCRRCSLCTTIAEPSGEIWACCGDGARHYRAGLRLPCALASQPLSGEPPMSKTSCPLALIVSVLTSSATFAAEKT